MAHSFLNGFGGSVLVGSFTFDVENWQLKIAADIGETTNTSSAGWMEHILTKKSWEGSCKSFFDTLAIPTGATANLVPGVRATFVLSVGSSGKSYSGTAQITMVDIENPVSGVVPFNIDFKGTGVLTLAS